MPSRIDLLPDRILERLPDGKAGHWIPKTPIIYRRHDVHPVEEFRWSVLLFRKGWGMEADRTALMNA
jgi:hypothetical protein